MFVEPSQSVTVISILYPSSLGSSPMKSILMLSKQLSETGREYNSSTGLDIMLLFCIQSMQEKMYELFRSQHI